MFKINGMVNLDAISTINVTGTKTVQASDIFSVSGRVNIDLNSMKQQNTKMR